MTAQLNIEISVRTPRWSDCLPDAAALAQKAAQMAWQRCGDNRPDTELSIVLADDSLLLSLNDRYRNKNEPTNILSFPADDDALTEMPRLLIEDRGYGLLHSRLFWIGFSLTLSMVLFNIISYFHPGFPRIGLWYATPLQFGKGFPVIVLVLLNGHSRHHQQLNLH